MELSALLKEKTGAIASAKPMFFRLSLHEDKQKLEELLQKGDIRFAVDHYEDQLKELWGVQNPSQVFSEDAKEQQEQFIAQREAEAPLAEQGVWVYFPWRSTIVHILEDAEFQMVRFARNQNLITKEEQERFYDATIGIAGLSVGNSVALTIAIEGGAKRIKLADFDTLDLSNLNRIRTGVHSLGEKKVDITAKQIYELNPYTEVQLFPEGLTKENIGRFFDESPKLDLIIDEIDSLAVKYLIREEAKKRKIAVLMAADNGENALIDIERYDKEELEYFHNRMPGINYEMLLNLNKFETGKLIAQHVGHENIPRRMMESLHEMGKTIVSWPQLGGPALVNGAAVAFCARRILNDQPLENNRAIISFDEILQGE